MNPITIPEDDINAAVALLRAGEVVAFPTETVCGLGADAANPQAVRQIFEVKSRPDHHPLIVHIADVAQLDLWAEAIPDTAWRLAAPPTVHKPRAPGMSAAPYSPATPLEIHAADALWCRAAELARQGYKVALLKLGDDGRNSTAVGSRACTCLPRRVNTGAYFIKIPCWFKTPPFRAEGALYPGLKAGVLQSAVGEGMQTPPRLNIRRPKGLRPNCCDFA